MELIRKGLWSTTFKNSNVFEKQLNFYEPQAAIRESKASVRALNNGIRTPQWINNDITLNSVTIRYKYYELRKLKNADFFNNEDLVNQLLSLFNNLSKIEWCCNDTYWYNHITKEFEYELSLLDCDVSKYLDLLHSLVPSTFIHGDCSVFNMGLIDNTLWLFDFQHGSYGPKGWDKAYFASTMARYEADFISLSPMEMKMTELISAVKYGRAIKKQLQETSERKCIFETWRT